MSKKPKSAFPSCPPTSPVMLLRAYPDGFTVRDEANALTAYAFRNGPLEDLHAGKSSSLLEDPSLSRITDDEMKSLMINASEKLAQLLEMRKTKPEEYQDFILAYGARYCRRWQR